MQHNLSLYVDVSPLSTLIFPRLWHAIYFCPLTQAQFQQLRSLASAFISQQVFPKITFSTLFSLRTQGDFDVFGPASQQFVLQ